MNKYTVKQFLIHVNGLRLNTKNNWYFLICLVEGKEVKLKGFGTWLQIFQIDGIDYAGSMGNNVKQFKTQLQEPFKEPEKAFKSQCILEQTPEQKEHLNTIN